MSDRSPPITARCSVAVLLFLLATAAAAHDYKFTDLGTLGGSDGAGRAINASGQVVGNSLLRVQGTWHAALWKGKKAIDLGPDGVFSMANGINEHGVIVGEGGAAPDKPHALMWHRGTVTDLGTLGGSISRALAVDRHGLVVGLSYLSDGVTIRGFTWADGVMVELPSLGGSNSFATAINARGLIAGGSHIADDEAVHACLWEGGKVIDLGSLGGRKARYSVVESINDAGVAVGTSDSEAGASHATLWQDGVAVDLGTLGGRHSAAYGINNKGEIVGYSEVPTDKHFPHLRAVLWNGTTPVDLTTLLPHAARLAGWELAVAYAINDDGVITGRARNKIDLGTDHAFRLEPRVAAPGR